MSRSVKVRVCLCSYGIEGDRLTSYEYETHCYFVCQTEAIHDSDVQSLIDLALHNSCFKDLNFAGDQAFKYLKEYSQNHRFSNTEFGGHVKSSASDISGKYVSVDIFKGFHKKPTHNVFSITLVVCLLIAYCVCMF